MKCDDDCKPQPAYTHTLTVEMPGTTTDANGQIDLDDDDNWDQVGRIRARFITRGGRESHIFKQIEATVTAVLMTPATAISRRIDPSWRLKLGDRVFNIHSRQLVNETGRVVQLQVEERLQPAS